MSERQREAVDAAIRLLDTATIDDIVPSIRQIAAETGRAPQTMMNAFRSRHELVMRLAHPFLALSEDGRRAIDRLHHASAFLADSATAMRPKGMPSLIAEVAQEYFCEEMSVELVGFRRQLLHTWASIPPRRDLTVDEERERVEFHQALTDFHQASLAEYRSMYEALLAAWGRSLRPPLTIEQLAVTLTALTEGLELRLVSDEHAELDEVAELFSRAVLATIASFTSGPGDDRSLEELFEPSPEPTSTGPT